MTLALLLVRVVVGLLFIGHGTRKLFGWFGGSGPEGTAEYFSSLGFRHSKRLAGVAGSAELVSGALLVTGFLTPIAATIIAMVMVNAILAAHWDAGLWAGEGGFEYPLVLLTVAVALAAAGPGPVSADALLGLDFAGDMWAAIALIAALLSTFLSLGTQAAEHPVESGR